MVSTVTVAYPLVKSMVASATCLPSAVFSCVVSFPAVDDPGEVVVDEFLEPSFEQPLIVTTGITSKATAAATCFIMNRTYPRDARHKLGIRRTAWCGALALSIHRRLRGLGRAKDGVSPSNPEGGDGQRNSQKRSVPSVHTSGAMPRLPNVERSWLPR
jgi:hypothetical protein